MPGQKDSTVFQFGLSKVLNKALGSKQSVDHSRAPTNRHVIPVCNIGWKERRRERSRDLCVWAGSISHMPLLLPKEVHESNACDDTPNMHITNGDNPPKTSNTICPTRMSNIHSGPKDDTDALRTLQPARPIFCYQALEVGSHMFPVTSEF